MKNFNLTLLLFASLFIFACGDDDATDHMHDDDTTTDYHIHMHEPNNLDKHMNGSMHLHIEMEDHNMGTVHHAKIRIYQNDAAQTVIYEKPDAAHVHEEDGLFEFHDDLAITTDNGFAAHTDWVLEAKVWGHEAGENEVMDTLHFHVHPE